MQQNWQSVANHISFPNPSCENSVLRENWLLFIEDLHVVLNDLIVILHASGRYTVKTKYINVCMRLMYNICDWDFNSYIWRFRGSNEGGILYRTLDNVPVMDQHMALGIFLELSFQRGSLSYILESVLLLLRLWDRGQDNEKNSSCTTAPLNPLLKRLERLSESKCRLPSPKILDEVCIIS